MQQTLYYNIISESKISINVLVTLVEDLISDTDSSVRGNAIAAAESGETIVFQGTIIN